MDGGPSDATCPKRGRPSPRGWPFNRFLFVFFWAFVALLSAVPILAIPGFVDASKEFKRDIGAEDWRLWYFAFSAVFVAPLIETALIALPIIWLRHHRVREWLLIALAASGMAVLHQSFAVNAVIVLPPFVVFAWVFVRRTRPPFNDGFILAASIHSIYNLVPTGAMLLYRYLPES